MRSPLSNRIFQSILVVGLFLHLVSSTKVKLYEDKVFSRLLIKLELNTADCINLPPHLQGAAGSIYTESCIILYVETKCDHEHMSIKIDQLENGGKYDLYEVMHSPEERFGRKVKSLKRCSTEEGGDSVNVDFYAGEDLKEPAYQYFDICECMNLPSMGALLAPLRKINNHGNCIILFKDLNCKGQKFELKGGISAESNDLAKLSQIFNSVSPCGNYYERCMSLSSIVTKFEITTNATPIEVQSSNVALAAKTTFRNNGNAIVSQMYSAKKEITETVETYRAHTESYFRDYKISAEIKVEVELDIPLIEKSKVTTSLSGSYEFQKNSTDTDYTKSTNTIHTEYEVNQKIKILPCTEYEVSSYVTLLENYPLQYVVYFEISGVARDGTTLGADKLKARLGGLDYIETKNNYTVIAKGYGSMVCNMGLESVISGEGKIIEGCKAALDDS